jgi:hypothetical protein
VDDLLARDRVALVGPVMADMLRGFRRREQRDWAGSRLRLAHYVTADWDDWRHAADLGRVQAKLGQDLPITDFIARFVRDSTDCWWNHGNWRIPQHSDRGGSVRQRACRSVKIAIFASSRKLDTPDHRLGKPNVPLLPTSSLPLDLLRACWMELKLPTGRNDLRSSQQSMHEKALKRRGCLVT